MAGALVDGVHDRLVLGEDILVRLLQIADPAERLRRRGDVVALGGPADVAQVDPHPIASDDFGGGEPIADEQLIDDSLNLLGVEIDVVAPPFLESGNRTRVCGDARRYSADTSMW
jgi:hypothetical protein